MVHEAAKGVAFHPQACWLSVQALPEEFAALTNLRALELNNTTFEGLDPLQPILGLSKLRTLLMSECDLSAVPEALWELPSLEVSCRCCRS